MIQRSQMTVWTFGLLFYFLNPRGQCANVITDRRAMLLNQHCFGLGSLMSLIRDADQFDNHLTDEIQETLKTNTLA